MQSHPHFRLQCPPFAEATNGGAKPLADFLRCCFVVCSFFWWFLLSPVSPVPWTLSLFFEGRISRLNASLNSTMQNLKNYSVWFVGDVHGNFWLTAILYIYLLISIVYRFLSISLKLKLLELPRMYRCFVRASFQKRNELNTGKMQEHEEKDPFGCKIHAQFRQERLPKHRILRGGRPSSRTSGGTSFLLVLVLWFFGM